MNAQRLMAGGIVLLLSCGCSPTEYRAPSGTPVAAENTVETIRELVDSEELILAITPRLKQLLAVMEKSPRCEVTPEDREACTAPASAIRYRGLAELDLESAFEQHLHDGLAHFDWPLATSMQADYDPLTIWRHLRVQGHMEDSQIGILSGRFTDGGNTFELKTKFEGRVRPLEGNWGLLGVKGKQTLKLQKSAEFEWEIVEWEQTEFHVVGTRQPLFENVTDQALPNPTTREELVRSRHQEWIVQRMAERSKESPDPKTPLFADWQCNRQFPAVSVVDFDRDGWDDLFVMDRWERSVLLRNEGDGTFRDVTVESGLEVDGFANCAAFFDIDNDGDTDVFVGRTTRPSLLFLNEGGTFRTDPEWNRAFADILFVVSVAVTDINRDGLQDLYLSTNAFAGGDPRVWIREMIPEADQATMIDRMIGKNMYLDRGGPANKLLINRGGTLEQAPLNDDAKMWRCSFQSAWADFDGDGDDDAYVCNDFAPDVLLRNDTPAGSMDIRLVDVTDQVMPPDNMAFGMGASWGDYDNDGRLDLYVSNMYSKAGMRIVPQAGKTDKRILPAAMGNFLYRNLGEKFEQVAGHGEDDQHVSKVGWSYGGQFADFDNDQNLDLYVPSGFFSPPAEVSTQEDL